MKKIIICFLSSVFISIPIKPQSFSYNPSDVEWGANYDKVVSFFVYAYPSQYQMTSWWEFKVTVENATLEGYSSGSQTFSGTNIQFKVRLTKPSVQAKITGSWICDNISRQTRYWKINVGAIPQTLSLAGLDEIKANSTYTYHAYYSGHTASTKYTWSVMNGRFDIISGQGTSAVTIRPNVPQGIETLNVTTGGLTATRRILITQACGVTNVTNQNITSNKNFSDCAIILSGVNIKNNAIVNFTAKDSIVIKSNFIAEKGTNVTFKVTGVAPRSAEAIEDMLFMEPEISSVSTNLDDIQVNNGNPAISSIRIYSTMGTLVHSSTSDIDIYSLGLNNGIYIIEKTDAEGNVYREKISLRK